jgi:hypothetical protein
MVRWHRGPAAGGGQAAEPVFSANFAGNSKKFLAHTQFFLSRARGDFGKVIDPEGRVVEPLECGRYWKGWGTFVSMQNQGWVRVRDFFPRLLKGRRPAFVPQGGASGRQVQSFFHPPFWVLVSRRAIFQRFVLGVS